MPKSKKMRVNSLVGSIALKGLHRVEKMTGDGRSVALMADMLLKFIHSLNIYHRPGMA